MQHIKQQAVQYTLTTPHQHSFRIGRFLSSRSFKCQAN